MISNEMLFLWLQQRQIPALVECIGSALRLYDTHLFIDGKPHPSSEVTNPHTSRKLFTHFISFIE